MIEFMENHRSKRKSRFCIYKIYWPSLGYYFGKTRGFGKRRNRHLREMKDGTHHNRRLIKYYQMYGAPKIKIVAFAYSDEELDVLEKQFLINYITNRRCLNLIR